MHIERHEVAVTTDASGDVTEYSPVVTGEVLRIRYVPDGSAPLDTGADLTVTEETSGAPIVTKANIGTSAFDLAPQQPVHAVADGAALLFASGGEPVTQRVPVAESRIKFVIASGGNAKAGTFHVWIGG